MNYKVLVLLIVVLVALATRSEAKKKKRSRAKLDYNLLSDEHLCQKRRCGKRPKGSWCQVIEKNGHRRAACVCPQTCNMTDHSPVCSVYGRQYDNKCLLHLEGCKKKRNIKVAYEAPCIASQSSCNREELKQFPFRLLDWFVHLRDNDEFGTIDPKRSVATISDEERRAVAQWKFSQLDRNKDGKLNNRELKRFRYVLMPLEHCAKSFFKACDTNGDKKLHADEWITCLVAKSWEWYQERTGRRLVEHNNPSTDIQ